MKNLSKQNYKVQGEGGKNKINENNDELSLNLFFKGTNKSKI